MNQTLASCGVATVTATDDNATWAIGNDRIAKTITWHPATGLSCAALTNTATGHTWRPEPDGASSPDGADGPTAGGEFTLTWDATELTGRQATALRGVTATADERAVTLSLTFDLPPALEVTLHYRLPAETAVIEQWLELNTTAAGTVQRVAPATLSAGSLPTPTLHWVRGLQGHGMGMPATGPYPAFRLRHEPLGCVRLESGLRSSWHEYAWLALDGSPTGTGVTGAGVPNEGVFAGLLYSGRWSAAAVAVEGATGPGATLDLATAGFAVPLAPGASWTSPAAFTGVYHGDLDAAAAAQATYMRRAVMPPSAPDFPWVQYNTWFAHLVDIDEDILRGEAELAAKLGVEVFVIDAGWWEPSRRTSDNFTTGLGLWQPSQEKFPHGIRAFGDYVRSLGMRFGIWVEPERVDLRRPGTWRDAWLVRHHDAIVSPPWPPDTVSGWLCYGHPDVQAWAIDWISRLVTEVNADWLKWDSNWWGVCTCTNHGHSATDGEFHQVQGVHNVMAELRRRFPGLIIENCSGGATRNDFAMLAQTHITWLHDSSTPNRRVRFHLAGATHFLPPELCNTWIVDADYLSRDEDLADPATPQAMLDEIVRSRMFGAFGISARLGTWTDAAFATVQGAVAQYKQLRPLLKQSRIVHLLPQPDLQCPDLALHGAWEAYAVLDPAATHGALWLFRAADGEPSRRIPLRGLDPARTYTLADVDTGHTVTATGDALATHGLAADLSGRTSALLLIDEQAVG